MRLALQGKTDGLNACRYEADDDSQLDIELDEWRESCLQTRLTPRVAPGDNEAMVVRGERRGSGRRNGYYQDGRRDMLERGARWCYELSRCETGVFSLGVVAGGVGLTKDVARSTCDCFVERRPSASTSLPWLDIHTSTLCSPSTCSRHSLSAAFDVSFIHHSQSHYYHVANPRHVRRPGTFPVRLSTATPF